MERVAPDARLSHSSSGNQKLPATSETYLILPTKLISDPASSDIECASFRLVYIENLVKWLNTFEDLVANKLITSLAVLISPLVSNKSTYDEIGIEAPKSFGYIEGLSLILRQLFEDIRVNLSSISEEPEPINHKLFSLLDKIDDLVTKLHSTAAKVDPKLQKMLQLIYRYKRKLPNDMSFLDSEIRELKDKSNESEITLSIWKSWTKKPFIVDLPHNLEIQWDSIRPQEILIHDISSDESSPNLTLPTRTQVELLHHLLQLISNRAEETFSQLANIEENVKLSGNILKTAYRQIHEDEKDCTISPSTYYVIIRYFENYTKISVTCFKSISSNIGVIKSLVSFGRKCLQANSSTTPHASMSHYPRNAQLNIPITVSDELYSLISNDGSSEDSLTTLPYGTLVPLKSPNNSKTFVTLWFSKALRKLSRRKAINRPVSDSGWMLAKRKELKSTTNKSFSNFIPPEENFLQLCQLSLLIDEVFSILTITLGILKKPNSSLNEGTVVDNIFGLTLLLATTTVHLHYYKEIPTTDRQNLQETFKQVETHLEKLTNNDPALHDDMANSLSKLSSLISSLERSLSRTFELEDETSQPTSQVETIADQINDNIQSFSDNIADHIAAKNGDSVWAAVCETDVDGGGGIIFKNHTSHEAHTYARLSVFKRLEIIISLLKYIDHIITITENNAVTVITQISQVRASVKHTKAGLQKIIKNGDVNRLNVVNIMVSLQLCKDMCHALTQVSEDIFVLLTPVSRVIKDLRSYVNLNFTLLKIKIPPSPTEIKLKKTKEKKFSLQMHHKEMGKTLMEMELTFRKLYEFPICVCVPLRFACVSEESDEV